VIHGADKDKIAADQAKGKAELGLKATDQAHQHSMDKAEHGLNVGVAAHDQKMDHLSHNLDISKTAHAMRVDTQKAITDTAQAMKPDSGASSDGSKNTKTKP
jgi:hypothetical protein